MGVLVVVMADAKKAAVAHAMMDVMVVVQEVVKISVLEVVKDIAVTVHHDLLQINKNKPGLIKSPGIIFFIQYLGKVQGKSLQQR